MTFQNAKTDQSVWRTKNHSHFIVDSNSLCNTDPARVDILHFDDPVLGPRQLPKFDDPKFGKVVISPESTFSIDLEKNEIMVSQNGSKLNVGDTLAYIVR